MATQKDEAVLKAALLTIENMPENEIRRKAKIEGLREVLRFKEEADYTDWAKQNENRYPQKFINEIGKCVDLWVKAAPWTQKGRVRAFGKNILGLGIYRTTATKEAVDDAITDLRDKELSKQIRMDVETKSSLERKTSLDKLSPKPSLTQDMAVQTDSDLAASSENKRSRDIQQAVVERPNTVELEKSIEQRLRAEFEERRKLEQEQEAKKQSDIISKFERQIVELKSELKGKKEPKLKAPQNEVQIHALQQKITELNKELSDLKIKYPKELAAYQQNVDRAREELEEAREQNEQLRQDKKDLRAELEAERKNNADWKQKHDALKKEKDQWKERFEALKKHSTKNVRPST